MLRWSIHCSWALVVQMAAMATMKMRKGHLDQLPAGRKRCLATFRESQVTIQTIQAHPLR